MCVSRKMPGSLNSLNTGRVKVQHAERQTDQVLFVEIR